MRTAVVILTYNSRAFLDACLESVRALRGAVEVLVADNGSRDDTLAHLRAAWPAVPMLDLGRNWGFAEGYNRALAGVDAEWLALLNPDAQLAPDWLEILLRFAAEHPAAAILGGKLLFTDADPAQRVLQSVGAKFTDAGTAFEIGWGEPDHGQYAHAQRTASIPGAALLIRREVFQALGGFDGSYFTYLEDVDLCWRAWLAGHEVWYVPAAEARHHFGGAGGGRAAPFRIRWMQRNRYANMLKHLEAGTLARGLVTSAAYDLYRVLEFGARGQWDGLQALAAGSAAFLRAGPGLWQARQAEQRARRRRDADLQALGLLVPAQQAFQEYRRLAALARSQQR